MQVKIYRQCENPDYRLEGDTLVQYKEPSDEASILLRENTNESRKKAVFFAYRLIKGKGDIPYLNDQSIQWGGYWPVIIPHQIANYNKYDYNLDSNGMETDDTAENWRIGIIRRERNIPPDIEKRLKFETYGTPQQNISTPTQNGKIDLSMGAKVVGIAIEINGEVIIAKL